MIYCRRNGVVARSFCGLGQEISGSSQEMFCACVELKLVGNVVCNRASSNPRPSIFNWKLTNSTLGLKFAIAWAYIIQEN